MNILVKGEKITITNTSIETITTGSINYFKCVFDFDKIWNSPEDNKLNAVAIFYVNPQQRYEQLIVNNQCIIPSEVLQVNMPLYIGIIGTRIEPYTVLTTNILKIDLTQGISKANSVVTPLTPDLYAQLLNQFNLLVTQCNEYKIQAYNNAELSLQSSQLAKDSENHSILIHKQMTQAIQDFYDSIGGNPMENDYIILDAGTLEDRSVLNV